MCHSLPPEIPDLFVDYLHDERTALEACCLVSKSWVPRSRMYLFSHVEFTSDSPLKSWVEAFPDPDSISPAHYTRTLKIQGRWALTTSGHSGVDVGRWARVFHNIVLLQSSNQYLVPFHGLSSTIRSLRLEFDLVRPSEVFGLMCSFLLLEDFALLAHGYEAEDDGWATPSTSPKLIGSLELRSIAGTSFFTHQLLDLPNGLNFTKIILSCTKEAYFKLATDLVSKCSNTLEIFYFINHLPFQLGPTSFNLSKGKKLKQLVFLCMRSGVRWVTEALRTVKSKRLQQITPRPDHNALANKFGEAVCQQWHDLDSLLVQFWASHSIRPKVTYEVGVGREDMRDYAPSLLPELTRRGLVDLAEYEH